MNWAQKNMDVKGNLKFIQDTKKILNRSLLILGIILMVLGVAIFFSIQSDVSRCNSVFGQFGQFISSDASSGCQLISSLQTASAIVVVVGIGMTIAGAAMKSESRAGRAIVGIIVIIFVFMGSQMLFPFPYGLIISFVSVGIVIWRIRKSKPIKEIKEEMKKDSNSLEIIKERYAKGEITKEEFDKMKEDLTD